MNAEPYTAFTGAPSLAFVTPEPDCFEQARQRLHFKNILVPLDLSENSMQSLRYAVPMAEQFGARLTLLHVIPPLASLPTGEYPLRDELEIAHAAEHALSEIARAQIGSDLEPRLLIRCGFVFETITAVAREIQADLIVLTTCHHSSTQGMFGGSIAGCMMGEGPCPVLVVHPCE